MPFTALSVVFVTFGSPPDPFIDHRMRATIAKTVGGLSKHATGRKTHITTNVSMRSSSVLPTRWDQSDAKNNVHNYGNKAYQEQEEDYYSFESFESTLDRVLEMTQLGKEQSVHWEDVVRSAYTAKSHYFEEESMNKYHLEENVSKASDEPAAVDVDSQC